MDSGLYQQVLNAVIEVMTYLMKLAWPVIKAVSRILFMGFGPLWILLVICPNIYRAAVAHDAMKICIEAFFATYWVMWAFHASMRDKIHDAKKVEEDEEREKRRHRVHQGAARGLQI